MQQEDEEAGDVVVRVRVESQVHETVHAAVQPDRRGPARISRFSCLTQLCSVPPIPSKKNFSRFDCAARHCRIRGIEQLLVHQQNLISPLLLHTKRFAACQNRYRIEGSAAILEGGKRVPLKQTIWAEQTQNSPRNPPREPTRNPVSRKPPNRQGDRAIQESS
jgi:hypothetical protein